MTKQQIVANIAAKAKIKKTQANIALNTFIQSVTGALKKGDRVSLVGFGTFLVAKRKPRKGFNPQTKEEIKIPAKKVPKFKPGQELKNAVK